VDAGKRRRVAQPDRDLIAFRVDRRYLYGLERR
jgi:hypothetical protein